MKRDPSPGKSSNSLEKKFTVKNKLGLHARPAAVFVETASRFDSDIYVRKGDTRINGKSIMGLLMLAAGFGTKVSVEIEGIDAKEAMIQIEKIFENNFNEG
jgi:phosphocarrier protein HPr